MSAEIVFVPLDDRGNELLNELEERTDVLPYKTNTRTGQRAYSLDSVDAGTDGFDDMLDRIASDWREHLQRTA